MAPGKFGAWVAATAARAGEPIIVAEEKLVAFLGHCPVSVLPVDPLVVQRLERLGIQTLGELARLSQGILVEDGGA